MEARQHLSDPRDHRKGSSFGKTDGEGVLPERISPSSINGVAKKETPQRKQKLHHLKLLGKNSSKREQKITEGWEKLSDEERNNLELDIFKPLDFFEILFNRMKANDTGEVITSLSELDLS